MEQYAKDEQSAEAQARAMKERIEARKKELAEKKAAKVCSHSTFFLFHFSFFPCFLLILYFLDDLLSRFFFSLVFCSISHSLGSRGDGSVR
jgi:hypothetical protein